MSARRPQGQAKLRERVQVEHALAHIGRWQGRRARYNGTRKNLFGLRRVAVVDNLHVIARQDTTAALRCMPRHVRRGYVVEALFDITMKAYAGRRGRC